MPMVLHMVNNMVLADLLTRVTSAISAGLTEIVTGIVIIGFGIAAVVILIVKRKEIGAYLRQERMDRRVLKNFFIISISNFFRYYSFCICIGNFNSSVTAHTGTGRNQFT